MHGQTIQQKLESSGSFSEPLIKLYSQQILRGLICLHSHKIIHKDLKGSNILVSPADRLKILDFGCSKQISRTLTNLNSELKHEIKGSIPWMSPEIIKQE
jgi:serine/threonine protein kinase